MQAFQNLILIGMPGSGKSTLGRILAERWGWEFLDVDLAITARHGKSLARLQDELGREGFLRLEADTLLNLQTQRTIIAPGGSAVYHADAMEWLRQLGVVAYLQVDETEIEARIGDLRRRGVVIAPGQGVLDLYHERHPLYLRFAHLVMPLAGKDPELSAKALIDRLASSFTRMEGSWKLSSPSSRASWS